MKTLPDPLWEASRGLCRNMPRFLATQWQTFHLQETVQLRFVTPINTVELLQRYTASLVLTTLRRRGQLPKRIADDPRFLSRGSFSNWNKTLQMALVESTEPALDEWRRLLLAPRHDFPELLNLLGSVMGNTGPELNPVNCTRCLPGECVGATSQQLHRSRDGRE